MGSHGHIARKPHWSVYEAGSISALLVDIRPQVHRKVLGRRPRMRCGRTSPLQIISTTGVWETLWLQKGLFPVTSAVPNKQSVRAGGLQKGCSLRPFCSVSVSARVLHRVSQVTLPRGKKKQKQTQATQSSLVRSWYQSYPRQNDRGRRAVPNKQSVRA